MLEINYQSFSPSNPSLDSIYLFCNFFLSCAWGWFRVSIFPPSATEFYQKHFISGNQNYCPQFISSLCRVAHQYFPVGRESMFPALLILDLVIMTCFSQWHVTGHNESRDMKCACIVCLSYLRPAPSLLQHFWGASTRSTPIGWHLFHGSLSAGL